jgi:hypothetical protein
MGYTKGQLHRAGDDHFACRATKHDLPGRIGRDFDIERRWLPCYHAARGQSGRERGDLACRLPTENGGI